MPRGRRQPGGFTLIEILVAMAIVGLAAGALYSGMYVAFKARQSTLESLEAARTARLALDAVGRDLDAVLPPVGLLAGTFSGADARRSDGRDADTLSFYDAADPNRLVEAGGDVEHVELALVEPADLLDPEKAPSAAGETGGVLVRRVVRNLLAPLGEAPVEQVICRRVVSFNVRYFDGLQWLDEWNSNDRDNALPTAVEATLELDPALGRPAGGGEGYRLVRIFRPSAAAPVTAEALEITAPAP